MLDLLQATIAQEDQQITTTFKRLKEMNTMTHKEHK